MSAVAASVSRLQDSLRQCQGHVNTLMDQAAATAQQQVGVHHIMHADKHAVAPHPSMMHGDMS